MSAIAAWWGQMARSRGAQSDLSTLQGALGGPSSVLAIYDARYNVATSGGLVQTWDDARGASGYGPQLVGFGATKPSYDAVTKVITTSGSNWLQTSKNSRFDLGVNLTGVFLGTGPAASAYAVSLSDDPYTNPIGFTMLHGGGGTGTYMFETLNIRSTPDGSTLRLAIGVYNKTGFAGAGGIWGYTEVWGRAREIVTGANALGAGTRALTFGGLPNSGVLQSGAAVKVQFALFVDHQLSAAEHDAILAYVNAGLSPVYDNTAPLIVCDGNSLTYGTNASIPGGATAYPGVLKSANAALSTYDVMNYGVPSKAGAMMLATGDGRVLSMYNASRSKNFYVYWEGINDIGTLASDAQLLANARGMCLAAKQRGFKVLVCTCIPWSTDPNAAARATYNTNIRAAVANGWADAVVDLAANGNLQTPSNATYFGADQTHLTDAGYNQVANDATNGIYPRLVALGL